ncbi:hypothetical protein FB567DRAFT_269948 [Paraphoma chrysanthemicola]|uniref:SNF2 N-terminal domain-containing protein n=1 Tax=Paraphoma chrysanthemicola TaxID=798071 RepID=A0A8K0W1I1_9PLEO|nr:hypothetical protein FB567DRAFT_269948 [Paraphoma chrysanthemicola]
MAPTQRSRKRRRTSDASDTIMVIPRQIESQQHPAQRTPLRETRTRANVGQSRGTASRIETTTASRPSPVLPGATIPATCCLFCRTRGGRAAYNCQFEEGSDKCTRCISDKSKTCRQPTSAEIARIEARCPRCIRRGFKACNGANPCDTCIRNKTTHLCQGQPPESQRQVVQSTGAVVDGHAQRTPTAERSRRKRRKVEIEEPETEHDSGSTLPTDNEDTSMDITPEEIEQHLGTTEMLLHEEEDDVEQTIVVEMRVPYAKAEQRLLDEAIPPSASPSTSGPGSLTSNRATSTPATTGSEDDKYELQQQLNRELPPKPGSRARRSTGRVSYVEDFPQESSDDELEAGSKHTDEEDDSDVYVSSASRESDLDDESDVEVIPDDASSAMEDEGDDYEDMVDMTMDDEASKPQPKRGSTKKPGAPRAGKGIDFDLPPIDNIEDIFRDLATKAVDLGLANALGRLKGRPINVTTMCSGTESPLLALDLLSKGLEKAGQAPIKVNHHFSAEIEVFKQSYIERNFAPPRLFRDVRDFSRENATTAVTAYGAEETIPSGIDILIAGFVCKDLSRLNSRQKDLDDDGESGDTWRAIYSYAKRFRPRIVLLENVKGSASTWETLVSKWDKIGYEARWLICDTKRYYLPQTRERMYMVAIEREQFGKKADLAVAQWQYLMQSLQRQCSSPYEAFLSGMLGESSDHNALVSEPDWALCKLRYDHIRSDERLGILRPITKWSENGTVQPPDIANRQWYHSQSSRVYDAIDVAHLQAAKKGYDSMHKMAVWDVSQNVDRFKADFGILPCITPGGCDFASNRQVALTGSQLLLLQGMPLNKMLFATETQRECQDLAGNAMSTTVIGASLVSAIICGWKSLRGNSVDHELPLEVATPRTKRIEEIVRPTSMVEVPVPGYEIERLDLEKLRVDAVASSRLCNCEGDKRVSKANIQVCSRCEHSACTQCAGNPKHEYSASSAILRDQRDLAPNDFIRIWKPNLPPRLKFSAFPDVRQLSSSLKVTNESTQAYINHMIEAQISTQHFCLQNLVRANKAWKALYHSSHARLELRIGKKVEWLLFVSSPPSLPGSSPIRKLFEAPVARATVDRNLLNATWEIYLPHSTKHTVSVEASPTRFSSWRSRLGLPDFKEETVPMTLHVKSRAKECAALNGQFEHLPWCGSASHSLYKRTTGSDLYLFLDPSLIGKAEEDGFVFSQDCGLTTYGESRICLARVNTNWRPWLVKEGTSSSVDVAIPGIWLAAPTRLSSVDLPLHVSITTANSVSRVQEDCSRPVVVLEALAQEPLRVKSFDEYAWALQQAKHCPKFSSWQSVVAASSTCVCAPVPPSILWHVDDKGIANPHEDRKMAASFERATKTRPAIFHIQAVSETTSTKVQVSLNVQALIHRAVGRMTRPGLVTTAWRLATDHEDLAPEPFPRFRLSSNSGDDPLVLSPSLSYLRNTQPRSLAWMEKQEMGKNLTISEVEEAVEANLGWRAEARAQNLITVRGGVLADLPSFGKTVTTIALIQNEFEHHTPEAILQRNRQLVADSPGYIDTAASLIVCPPPIASQWQTELKKFLGSATYDTYNVLLVASFHDLVELSVQDIQKSRIIIVSWTVFAEQEYISHLAHFAAMPEPSVTGRRAIDTWFSRVLQDVPDQIRTLMSTKYKDFMVATKDTLAKRLQEKDFQATLPIRIQHGSAYESFKAMHTPSGSSKKKTKSKPTVKRQASSQVTADHQVPLLHLFCFNRVIVDEYHYLNDDKDLKNTIASVCVKRILANKRWVLSGTPALGNFSDVNQIASYLGISLGRYHFGNGTATTQADRALRADQTLVEDFLSQTEIMSRQWHRARHERAQEFLDLFVRQNEPCLGHIPCEEKIMPVELDMGHHAIYLELSQHLISQKMQIKKLNNKLTSDKIDRLNASLNDSASAEDALLKSALVFETHSGESGLKKLGDKRSEQREGAKADLYRLMTGFEGLSKTDEISELYTRFKEDIKKYNWLGDDKASSIARKLLKKAESSPDASVFSELRKLSKDKRTKLAKKLLSDVRETARELALRIRSERFVNAIQDLLKPLTDAAPAQTFQCSSPLCTGTASVSQLHIISHCGHSACEHCLLLRTNSDTCVHPECNVNVQSINLVRATELGSIAERTSEHSFGSKVAAITELIQSFPGGDQGLVFAPNDEVIAILETVFEKSGIAYHSVRGCKPATTAKIIEDFKTDDNVETQSTVLLLNLGSESAAGVNLVNANHIVFVSPLLSKTQYEYDSAMAQAIARSRRYGQEKKVHIYHVIAQRTIDVDILELRHKRVSGITTAESCMRMPAPLAKKKTTTLVKNKAGDMALVPATWLADPAKRKKMKLEDAPSKFTSLINFSDTFRRELD